MVSESVSTRSLYGRKSIRFLSAFPVKRDGAVRPVRTPLSLVQGAPDKSCRDVALCSGPFLFRKEGGLEAPSFHADYWREVSGENLELVRFFADQSLQGGMLARRSQTNSYDPYFVTEPGSVFVLSAVAGKESAACDCIRKWLKSGLPLPRWARDRHGESYQGNPFLPQDGFGEIVVNHKCHVDHRSTVLKTSEAAFPDTRISHPACLKLKVTLQFDGPFLVNDSRFQAKENDPDLRPRKTPDGKIVLPASSIRGAFRSQAERICRTIGKSCLHPRNLKAKADEASQHPWSRFSHFSVCRSRCGLDTCCSLPQTIEVILWPCRKPTRPCRKSIRFAPKIAGRRESH